MYKEIMAQAAIALEAITPDEFRALNTLLVRNCMNNAQWRREEARIYE